jgi:hypothetical protein
VANQKEIERRYLDEARRASTIFPDADAVASDPLDFLLRTAKGVLGIEVTELCRADERAEGARLGYVAPRAKGLYSAGAGATPVDVSATFSQDAGELQVDDLARGLAAFVYTHRDGNRNFNWRDDTVAMPPGYSSIGIFKPMVGGPDGTWRYIKAFSTELATRDMIAARIAEKNARLPTYRKIASEVWLLIVIDLFLGAGEVDTRPDHLAAWTFNFDFDKVLLFSRQPGGSGEVFELRGHTAGGNHRSRSGA